jgi:sulfatase modifying factor 1
VKNYLEQAFSRFTRILASTLISLFVLFPGFSPAKESGSTRDMVLVRGGTFIMGSNKGYVMESPEHAVTLKSFYIDKYEVTVAQYRAFCRSTHRRMPAAPPWGWKDRYPMVGVNWYDATAYAAWAGKRLPTEAEWEFAARGGILSKGYTYSGSNVIDSVAWYESNSKNKAHPVGTKKPNELGIYDMSGNAVEWCSDRYDDNYYSSSPKEDPRGPRFGHDRVLRGGSYRGNPDICRATYRNSRRPRAALEWFGFRCARDE